MSVSAVLYEDDLRVVITMTDLPVIPAPGDPWPAGPWTLSRSDGLTETVVRGGLEQELTESPAAVLTDREYPLSKPFLYVLRYLATGGPVQLYSEWVVPPQRELPRVSNPVTGEGVDVTIVEWPAKSREARSSSIDVDGRPGPVVLVGQMSAWSSQMVLRTMDAGPGLLLERVLAAGQIVLVRGTKPSVEDVYYLVTSETTARTSSTAEVTRRLHTLTGIHTTAPAPSIVSSGATLADIAAAYAGGTLADIAADFTYLYELAAAPL